LAKRYSFLETLMVLSRPSQMFGSWPHQFRPACVPVFRARPCRWLMGLVHRRSSGPIVQQYPPVSPRKRHSNRGLGPGAERFNGRNVSGSNGKKEGDRWHCRRLQSRGQRRSPLFRILAYCTGALFLQATAARWGIGQSNYGVSDHVGQGCGRLAADREGLRNKPQRRGFVEGTSRPVNRRRRLQ